MMTPRSYYRFKALQRRPLAVLGRYALLLFVAPRVWSSGLGQTLLSQVGIGIIACLAYNVLLGQGGMLSFGHAVYSGMGAFLAIHTLNQVGGHAGPAGQPGAAGGRRGGPGPARGAAGFVSTQEVRGPSP